MDYAMIHMLGIVSYLYLINALESKLAKFQNCLILLLCLRWIEAILQSKHYLTNSFLLIILSSSFSDLMLSYNFDAICEVRKCHVEEHISYKCFFFFITFVQSLSIK